MSRILCPYCCKRFEADEVHFRLKAAVKKDNDILHDMREDEEISFRRRSARSDMNGKSDGRITDEYLLKYYNEFGAPSDSSNFERYSMQLPYIEFDRLNPAITYDFAAFEEYGFINRIKVDGQILDERLCPYCHNRVVEGAGKQEMQMISVIGSTSAGKSVYLAILNKVFGEDKNLKASIFFKGNEDEEAYFNKNYNSLIRDNKRLNATNGLVPPVPFEVSFTDPATNEKRSVLIVFRDIMGESVQNLHDLGLSGKHIRESSGLLYLLDPCGFSYVEKNITRRTYQGGMQAESLTALKRYLTGDEYEELSSIPTAIVVAKSDIIKEMGFFNSDRYSWLVKDESWRQRHPGFINSDVIEDGSDGVKEFLHSISEDKYITNAADTFKNHRFFMCSSLGYDPDGNTDSWTKIEPFNVTEPFYWLLFELGILPCRMTRVYTKKRKDESKEISILYYRTDSAARIEERFNEQLKNQGMTSIFPWDKWVNGEV